MLTIYGRANSFNVQKVAWIAAELGVVNRRVDAGRKFGGLDDPAFRAINPHGRVPVIDDRGVVVWESNAIVRYVTATYGSGTAWWPTDPGLGAQADQWMDWASNNLNAGFMGVFLGFYRTPEHKRDAGPVATSLARAAADYGLLDKLLQSRPLIAGAALSIADVPIGATLFRYSTLDIERPTMPNLEAYYKRLTERPAYARHVMVAYDELKGNL